MKQQLSALVDADTMAALREEARKQQRSLGHIVRVALATWTAGLKEQNR
jgi:Ribbon-helix-helix protein, copG family